MNWEVKAMNEIPFVVELLYGDFVMPPDPKRWPEWVCGDPVKGHSLYAFYQGLTLGLSLSSACLDR